MNQQRPLSHPWDQSRTKYFMIYSGHCASCLFPLGAGKEFSPHYHTGPGAEDCFAFPTEVQRPVELGKEFRSRCHKLGKCPLQVLILWGGKEGRGSGFLGKLEKGVGILSV